MFLQLAFFFLFLWLSSITLSPCTTTICLLVDITLFPCLAIVNSAAMNIGIHVFLVYDFVHTYAQEWDYWNIR